MLVIAILGIFFAIVSQFDFSSRVNQEKATNFAYYIADIIRDARHDEMVGRIYKINHMHTHRWIEINGVAQEMYSFVERNIGGAYYRKTKLEYDNFGAWEGFLKIKEIYVSDKGFSDDVAKLEINSMISKNNILFVFSQNAAEIRNWSERFRTFKIVVEYKGFKRYIYGDILSGAIYVLNSESK